MSEFAVCRAQGCYSLSNMRTNDEMARLQAAVSALGDVDVSAWPEDTLKDQLGELSATLVALTLPGVQRADAQTTAKKKTRVIGTAS